MRSGIYQILHAESGRRYIGQSKDIRYRLRKHREKLAGNKHHNRAIQSAWNKYSSDAFLFEPIIYCSLENLNMYEEDCIKAFSSNKKGYGYNFRTVAETNRGMRFKSKLYKAGDKYNRLTFIERVEDREGFVRWKFSCECGKVINALVYAVISGNTKSCGCWNLQNLKRMREGIKFELFGEITSVTKGARILRIGRNSIRDRIKKLGETPQQAADHFVRKQCFKSLTSVGSLIEHTIQGITA